ncbi:MAG: hypothetical protein GY928_14165 [Colwellia sp.]|nr:hypothetical protein [Colwellia sp.]
MKVFNSPQDINLYEIAGNQLDKIFNRVYECSDHLDERTLKELETENNGKSSPCWLADSKATDIYSRVRLSGKSMYIHRAMYKLFNPEDSIADTYIDHKCRSTKVNLRKGGTGCCVNPDHLMALRGDSGKIENSKLIYSRQKLDNEYVPDQFKKFDIDSSDFNFDDLPVEDLFSLEPEQKLLEIDLLGVFSTKTVHHNNIDSAVLEQVYTDRERYKDILFNAGVTDDFIIDAGEFTDIFDEL